jgi:hypothetical protein
MVCVRKLLREAISDGPQIGLSAGWCDSILKTRHYK